MQHGGSGLGFTHSEIEALDWDLIEYYVERLEREREREAKAIRDAHNRGKG